MEIGICSVVYNGYAKFIPKWIDCISKLTVKPTQVVLIIGKNAGEIPEMPDWVSYMEAPIDNLGFLKNLAVENTKTEWIISLDIDDQILPNAIEEFSKHQDGDIIVCAYKDGEVIYKPRPTRELILSRELQTKPSKDFFHGSVPFRRKLWEKTHYVLGDCHNALFWIDCALQDAKFVYTDVPCLTYDKWEGSHSNVSPEVRAERIKTIMEYKRSMFSIYMIVKNEEEMITEALESVRGVDELVVCDTGSTDKTIEIAKKYTDKVYTDYLWNDDFSEAKNYACNKCTNEWVMSLDADCRLEPGGLQKIQEIINTTKLDVINILLICKTAPSNFHHRAKIYRNNGKIKYEGKAHEVLNVLGKNAENGLMPVIYYDYSPNHKKDPERYIRILKKALEENPKSARNKFYLASSYYDLKMYIEAIPIFLEYIEISQFLKEKAEAYVKLAECYWYTNQGDKARASCLKAININPDYSFALRLMSKMHYEPNKSKWLKIAKQAEDKDVLFKR